MKARITQPAEKKVLCCGMPPERMQIVSMCAADFGAETVTAYDGTQTISQLLKSGGAENTCAAPQDECMVFAGFDRTELNSLLDSLKGSGIRVPLKAVLTPHNAGWKLCDLIAELKKEREYMTGGGAK